MNIHSKKGFTLVEIIVAGLIISIAAAGTFSAYVIARQFSNKFHHKSVATNLAVAAADELRHGGAYEAIAIGPGQDLTANAPTGWAEFAASVDNPTIVYDVDNVWLGDNGIEYTVYQDGIDAAALPAPLNSRLPFKKITVRITWDERQAG